MRLFYTDHFELPLPEGHRFPMSKYRLLRRHVASSDLHRDDVLLVPPAATDDQLLLVHDAQYVRAVVEGSLTAAQIRRIGFPWSPKMVERSRRSTGATIQAADAALEEGIAANLAGGTHHAMTDTGEGYCVFNDAAVAIRTLQSKGSIQRACVVDLDVHQGNGTAEIFASDPSVFTLSVHGDKNFPLRKSPSDLDIALQDGTADGAYLEALSDAFRHLDYVARRDGNFDICIYLAGADPYSDDRLGRLNLSMNGLKTRDQMAIQWCFERQIPCVITMAGGYSPNVSDIVAIHATTLSVAHALFQQPTRKI